MPARVICYVSPSMNYNQNTKDKIRAAANATIGGICLIQLVLDRHRAHNNNFNNNFKGSGYMYYMYYYMY